MKNKILSLFLIMQVALLFPSAHLRAAGIKEGVSSLVLPTTGQRMNGEGSSAKTKLMGGVEAIGITTVAILAIASGGGAVWAGIGPLIANHVWSGSDAYATARKNEAALLQAQIVEVPRPIESRRPSRYDIRERIRRAGETAE